MKSFFVWLSITVVLFATAGASYHFYLKSSPRKILVAINSSYAMQTVWPRLPGALDALCRRPYTEFALVTEKNRVHGWATECSFRGVTAYAQRDFSKFSRPNAFPEVEEANETYLITNAKESEIKTLSNWKIIHLK